MGVARQYRPRKPKTTALYQILSEHLEAFLAEADSKDRTVPKFVRDELEGLMTRDVT